jgi:glycosyltransferase involved in cell wall biosynthesis
VTRVLLVGKGAPDRGGIPTFLETLRHGPLSAEHDLTFLNVAHSGTPQGGRPTVANIVRTGRDAVAVWRAARDRDIVHIHSALAPAVTVVRAGLLALAGRLRGCSVVVHAHGGDVEFWLVNRMRRTLMTVAMLPVQRVVAVWAIGERVLRIALGSDRVVLIDNGVSLDDFQPPTPHDGPPRILYVGLLTARKGVVDLIEASSILHDRGVEHELWLLGGTPDEGPDAEAPVRLAAGGRARLLGTRPPEEMPQAYAQCDVFCLPSWWEAMPLSILEAMAGGLPVVATDVGDVAREVEDGVTGFVVPVRSPERLAAALEQLLVDPERRARMGAAGRARVEKAFSSAVTAAAVGDLYAALTPASGKGRR